MHYFVYKTINLINGKYYIGAHKTENIDDDYLGSGTILKQAILKYGHENFERTILKFCETHTDMYRTEAEFVTQSVVDDPLSYNVKLGGQGGWDHVRYSDKRNKSISNCMKEQYASGERKGWSHIPSRKGKPGIKHTDKAKRLISENNGSLLSDDIIKKRIDIYNGIEKKRGYIGKFASLIGVSHTSARRFINKYISN